MPLTKPIPVLITPKNQALHKLRGCQLNKDCRDTLRLFNIMASDPRPWSPDELAAKINFDRAKVLRFLRSGMEIDSFIAFEDNTYMVNPATIYPMMRSALKKLTVIIEAANRFKNAYLEIRDG